MNESASELERLAGLWLNLTVKTWSPGDSKTRYKFFPIPTHDTPVDYYHSGQGNAPADYRRVLNQQHRAREKAAIRKAEISGDWDDFYLPPRKRNANWNWW